MKLHIFIFSILIILLNSILQAQSINGSYPWIEDYQSGNSIKQRIEPPKGYQRIKVTPGSFGGWLRHLPLKSKNLSVLDYLGRKRLSSDDSTLAGVIEYSIRGKKLEQCMDILYRLYAEYLLSRGNDNHIKFPMPGGQHLYWNDWKQGFRPEYHGVEITMRRITEPDSSRAAFEQYLKEIFYHSFTQTAYFAYSRIDIQEMQIGDFIVKKGRRGHAVMIMDIAVDDRGNKVVLIGQGDTPARQFHLLNYRKDNPWFPVDENSDYPELPIKKKMNWSGLRRFCYE
ncbi:hypothetical protein GF337_03440 [candidate division KSB1 bacterium]|nr:hypothetical protein [candidate division KSB1 bacterium]